MFNDTLPPQAFPPIPSAAPALPAELTIYAVDELLPQWLAWLDDPDAPPLLAVQAAAVEQVDAAGVQLLVSLGSGLARRHRRLSLLAPSPALADTCRRLGLAGWLAEVSEGGSGAAAAVAEVAA